MNSSGEPPAVSRRGRGRIRIVDVAAAARVSQSTASKSLNGSPEIPEATRLHVEETARKLGYRPNVIARSLKGWHSQSIGVVTDDGEGFFSTTMMRGVEQAASARSSSVFLCNTLGDLGLERHHLLSLLDKQVDGIIMLGAEVRRRDAPAVDLGGVPYVYLYCYSDDDLTTSVVPDDVGGGRSGGEYLVSLGHRRIAFINGPERYESSRQRFKGYAASLGDAGVPVDHTLVRFSESDWFPRAGYRMMEDILATGSPPDAIFAASDHLAWGAISALQAAGYRVPEDVSVLGFDDRPVASELPIPLTTIALPQQRMGLEATQLLFEQIDGGPAHTGVRRVETEIVVRDSVIPR